MRIPARVLRPCPVFAGPHVPGVCAMISLLALLAVRPAQARKPCRDCPPRDDRALQSILDDCAGRVCELPAGVHTLVEPLVIGHTMSIKGAGRGSSRKPGQPITEIRMADGVRQPAFLIEGVEGDIRVTIEDLVLHGGGIHVGGQSEPCLGIEDPLDPFDATLILKDVSILSSAVDAVRFEGDSLVAQDFKVENTKGIGAYLNVDGDAVLIDAELVGNERWGVYICSLSGTGQVFMNDVSVSANGRGGIAIVGKGSPPTFRTVCMQNTGAAFNFRFGVLLFDVARTLLYNVQTGFTFSDPHDLMFGDGIAVSASDDVFLWDVTSNLNNRAGYAAFGPTASEMSHVHLVGELNASDNSIDLAIEGSAVFDPHHMETLITGLCGFPDEDAPVAPAHEAHCQQGSVVVDCEAIGAGLAPPDPLP
jgi:hypothetical protein